MSRVTQEASPGGREAAEEAAHEAVGAERGPSAPPCEVSATPAAHKPAWPAARRKEEGYPAPRSQASGTSPSHSSWEKPLEDPTAVSSATPETPVNPDLSDESVHMQRVQVDSIGSLSLTFDDSSLASPLQEGNPSSGMQANIRENTTDRQTVSAGPDPKRCFYNKTLISYL